MGSFVRRAACGAPGGGANVLKIGLFYGQESNCHVTWRKRPDKMPRLFGISFKVSWQSKITQDLQERKEVQIN